MKTDKELKEMTEEKLEEESNKYFVYVNKVDAVRKAKKFGFKFR